MKKITITFATLSLLTLAACGDSSAPAKQPVIVRKLDKSSAVTKEVAAPISAKEGENPSSTKKSD